MWQRWHKAIRCIRFSITASTTARDRCALGARGTEQQGDEAAGEPSLFQLFHWEVYLFSILLSSSSWQWPPGSHLGATLCTSATDLPEEQTSCSPGQRSGFQRAGSGRSSGTPGLRAPAGPGMSRVVAARRGLLRVAALGEI